MDKGQPRHLPRELELLKRMLETHESEVDCDVCAEQMDCLAELVLAEKTPQGALEAIMRHIECCHCCHSEFKALVTIMRMEQSLGVDQE